MPQYSVVGLWFPAWWEHNSGLGQWTASAICLSQGPVGWLRWWKESQDKGNFFVENQSRKVTLTELSESAFCERSKVLTAVWHHVVWQKSTNISKEYIPPHSRLKNIPSKQQGKQSLYVLCDFGYWNVVDVYLFQIEIQSYITNWTSDPQDQKLHFLSLLLNIHHIKKWLI